MRPARCRLALCFGVAFLVIFIAEPRMTKAESPPCPADNAACPDRVAFYFPELAVEIEYVRNGVDRHKETARRLARQVYDHEQWLIWGVLAVGFFTTVSAAVARAYPEWTLRGVAVDLRLVPIVLAAIATLLTGAQNYYRLDVLLGLHRTTAHELATLQGEINYALIVAFRETDARESGPTALSAADVTKWHQRLADTLARYEPREPGGA